ncbi:hypothetical protein BGP_6293 [Beggiatoa sp. PS]|nr:hypothetical protein BGP_6293 [Beggiatoa sp. PS]
MVGFKTTFGKALSLFLNAILCQKSQNHLEGNF